MTIVFASHEVAEKDRREATYSAFLDQIWPTSVEFDDPLRTDATMERIAYGSTSIFRSYLTGLRLSRNVDQIRRGPAEVLAIAVQERSVGGFDQYGHQRMLGVGDMMLCDLNTPYDYYWPGRGASQALYIPLDQLDLPHEVIRGAAGRLISSPLCPLLTDRIAAMANNGDMPVANPIAAEAIGSSTIDIARALLASAYDPDYARGAMAVVLLPRIRGYIRRHLGDPELSAGMIAEAHGISVRKLFRLCADAGFGLEQWIIACRLEGVRNDLARPDTRQQSVARIGRRWGVTNPSFLSRRFREVYGMSPREWRVVAGVVAEDA
ncbi:helix-turn-helix domain-containing protein [Gordonia sp. NPDC127522]|uniref:helix-turn-helix domain-containing protein n=1 Tax=Gordonia sp. NPDC127522 TaxID=3345390 RepID=UPI003631A7F1